MQFFSYGYAHFGSKLITIDKSQFSNSLIK